jgi:hypothetical protein
MELEFQGCRLYHRLSLRVEHHELIGMQTEPDVVCLGQRACVLKCTGNSAGWVELVQGVAGERVGGERKNLARYAERADAKLVAPLDRISESNCVVVGDFGQVPTPVPRRQSTDVAMSRGPELDW